MAKARFQHLRNSIVWPIQAVILIWAIQLFQFFTPFDLGHWGIKPRDLDGLKGILTAPLIHAHDSAVSLGSGFNEIIGDFSHILSNTPPLFVLSVLIFYFYRQVAWRSLIMMYVLTGLSVWLLARGNSYHVGASGVIYAMVAFVFWNGLFQRNVKSLALALVVAFYYGGMFMGILPREPGISWESHLLGGIVGIFTAYWFRAELKKSHLAPQYSWETEPQPEEQSFLPRDTFEKRKSR